MSLEIERIGNFNKHCLLQMCSNPILHLSAKINKYVKNASNSNRIHFSLRNANLKIVFRPQLYIFSTKHQLRLFIIVARNVLFEMRFSFIFTNHGYIQIISISSRRSRLYNHENHQHTDTKWYFCFRRIFFTSESFEPIQEGISHVWNPRASFRFKISAMFMFQNIRLHDFYIIFIVFFFQFEGWIDWHWILQR